MSDVSPSMVKSLRDRTGAGMMACRDALRETSGDEEEAIEAVAANTVIEGFRRSFVSIEEDGMFDQMVGWTITRAYMEL